MIIVISRPELVDARLSYREVTLMRALLDQGLGLLHVRKPTADFAALASLIDRFKMEDRPKIVLHPPGKLFGQPDLDGQLADMLQWMRQMGLHRLHIPAWWRLEAGEKLLPSLRSVDHADIVLSTGIHTSAELEALSETGHSSLGYDYVLVSPLFDSLSKRGYKANPMIWRAGREKTERFAFKLIGMGGIRAENLPAVRNAGFDGAALLGAVWQPLDIEDPLRREKKIIDYFNRCVHIWENAIIK